MLHLVLRVLGLVNWSVLLGAFSDQALVTSFRLTLTRLYVGISVVFIDSKAAHDIPPL